MCVHVRVRRRLLRITNKGSTQRRQQRVARAFLIAAQAEEQRAMEGVWLAVAVILQLYSVFVSGELWRSSTYCCLYVCGWRLPSVCSFILCSYLVSCGVHLLVVVCMSACHCPLCFAFCLFCACLSQCVRLRQSLSLSLSLIFHHPVLIFPDISLFVSLSFLPDWCACLFVRPSGC